MEKSTKKYLGFFPLQWAAIIFVAIVSFAIHLPRLDHPCVVVFDETHFGGFISDYLRGICFFDIHPPLAKLMLAGQAYVTGYHGDFNFSKMDSKYSSDFYIPIRFLPAFLCSLASPLMTATLLLQHVSISMSVLCGLLFSFEFNQITQSRLILTDGILYFFVALSVFTTAIEETYESGYFLIFIQTLAASSAFCTKFTAAGVFILIAVSHFKLVLRRPHWFLTLVIRGLFVSIVFFIFLYSVMVIHIKAMPIKGYGDLYLESNYRTYPMPKRVWKLLLAMYRYNSQLGFTHPFQTYWYQWPFVTYTPLFLYHSSNSFLFLFSNPVVSALSFIGFFVGIFAKEFDYSICYLISYLPFILVSRCTFNYHYEIPLMFGILSFCRGLSTLIKSRKIHLIIAIFLMILVVACFIFWFPWIYATNVTRAQMKRMIIWPQMKKSWGYYT
ncbi:Dolichyl-phosphate-mannose-protein mannosyltransferase [Tritrichomonas foetus]|uniref:Dolichyl-phosphate-mannose-protein mannosyltransferase n=1 Tax=Tritrichomonas foetus TaxID=1144522 RepID=A0A1J4KXZ6_9EUKA|nr:Dolichyl-phosphate-mannose-protein mannosyltransferase [Tritrichomonas foetus]|eukprot:OHT14437.1 Dolichyl-phosphate-mannose-protein mannosyltransferase [Tritrichomonas foetus]